MKYFIAQNRLFLPISILLIYFCGNCNTPSLAQTKIKPSIQTTKISNNFYKLYVHDFVNMLVFNGADGALLVDTGCEPVALVAAELEKIGINDIKFIINTHSHSDHVDGNALFGQDALIVSSQQCRSDLLKDVNFPKAGLPNFTFSDSISIHFNDEEINLYFMPGHAHDDIVVHFTKSNIACIGDIGFHNTSSTWPGYSANVYDMEKSLIWMANHFSSDVNIIHGHVLNYTLADLKKDVKMVTESIKLAIPYIKKGLNHNQIIEQNPFKDSTFKILRENSEKWIWNLVRDKNTEHHN